MDLLTDTSDDSDSSTDFTSASTELILNEVDSYFSDGSFIISSGNSDSEFSITSSYAESVSRGGREAPSPPFSLNSVDSNSTGGSSPATTLEFYAGDVDEDDNNRMNFEEGEDRDDIESVENSDNQTIDSGDADEERENSDVAAVEDVIAEEENAEGEQREVQNENEFSIDTNEAEIVLDPDGNPVNNAVMDPSSGVPIDEIVQNDGHQIRESSQEPDRVETSERILRSATKSRINPTTPKASKRSRTESPEPPDDDDGMTCTVCLDSFTNSGPHRLISLKCGHVFGMSCVERWLKSATNERGRRCPTCNFKASLKDIRVIYARKLVALDTSEKDRIMTEMEKVKSENTQLQLNLTKARLGYDLQEKKIKSLQQRIALLENCSASNVIKEELINNIKVSLIHKISLCKKGGCRVLAFSPNAGLIVVSQQTNNPLFPGFGLRKLEGMDMKPTNLLNLHMKQIRDVVFHPQDQNLLLTVSLDQTAKIVDTISNSTVQTYTDQKVLWSCCWHWRDPNSFLVGSQNGIVQHYDRRQNREPVKVFEVASDRTPVVSLAAVPPTHQSVMEQGGFITCRLNAIYVYKESEGLFPRLVSIEGPNMSLNYNLKTQMALYSIRPNHRYPTTRHVLNQLAVSGNDDIFNHIHTFNSGTASSLMSRSCQFIMPDNDVWVSAYNESGSSVELFSVNKGAATTKFSVPEAVIDLCPLQVNNSSFLASLSEKNLLVHKIM